MNKKIKIIELLNKIANEEFPKRIKFKDKVYEDKSTYFGTGYVTEYDEWFARDIDVDDVKCLNDYVEILEDNTEEIEELDRNLKFNDLIEPYGINEDLMWTEIIKQHNKINEIIKYIKRKEKANDKS